jgi:hypothetical protein
MINPIREHEFTVILASPEQSEEDANALYEAGCFDGSISASGGVTRIDFHRQGANLEDAIRSAIANVQSSGFQVAQVVIEPKSLMQDS